MDESSFHNLYRWRQLQEEAADSTNPVDDEDDDVPGAAPITVLNPMIDEILYNGNVALIRWVSNVELYSVEISLSDGTTIATNIQGNQGTYYWKVEATPGNGYTVIIHGYLADGSSSSLIVQSDIFSIQEQGSLAITEPVKNQVVMQGDPISIQ